VLRVRRQRCFQIWRDGDKAALAALGVLGGDFDETGLEIDLAPVQPRNLRRAQSGKESDGERGNDLRRGGSEHSSGVCGGEDAGSLAV